MSVHPSTNDAVIPPIVNSSSAAFAAIILAFLSFFSYIDIAILSFIISDFETISDIVWYVSRSLWNHFFTLMILTPHLRRYAHASNVLTPVLKVKFLVSNIIPAYNASFSSGVNSIFTGAYSNISVTSSDADDAYTSWNVRIAFSM